jgi:hypothetical protein
METLNFNDLYLFVGPPMMRGPPPMPLPSFPPSRASATLLLPSTLPRPPPSCSKRSLRQRQQPYHYVAPSQRRRPSQLRSNVKMADLGERNTRDMQMIMSELELEYQASKNDWANGVDTTMKLRGADVPEDSPSIWTTMLEMPLGQESVAGEYF